jgi:Mu-like prophage protein Com.
MRKHEIRCGNCNRLLAKGQAHDLEIKCLRCGAYNHLSAASTDPEGRRASRELNGVQENPVAAVQGGPR